jgi:hypothetical protein
MPVLEPPPACTPPPGTRETWPGVAVDVDLDVALGDCLGEAVAVARATAVMFVVNVV